LAVRRFLFSSPFPSLPFNIKVACNEASRPFAMPSRDAETVDISHTSDNNVDHEKPAVPEDKGAIGKLEYDETHGSTSFVEVTQLRQGLHQRHIQMIALAGTIGTGLFLGSGIAITRGGPVGALISYTVVGLAAACVCLATGEMGALVPLSGGINRYAETFVDPALAFAEGCNSIYGVLVGTPAEMVAAAVLVNYWSDISNAVVSNEVETADIRCLESDMFDSGSPSLASQS
jgi:amino acid transporter